MNRQAKTVLILAQRKKWVIIANREKILNKKRDKYYNKRDKNKLLSVKEIIWKLQEKIRKVSL